MNAINMKTKLVALSTIIIFLVTIEGVALAQPVDVGVSKGETFDYSYNLLWSSTDPTATIPSDYVQLNNTQAIQFTITDISGSKISMEKTNIFKNGTQTKESGFVDINTGDIKINYGTIIVGSNLNAGDKLYPSGGHAIINDTTTRAYPSGPRETNHYISETGDQNNLVKVELYFDKQKGVAVNYYFESHETSDGYTATTQETLTNTNSNVWMVAPGSTPTATGISPTPTATGISPTPTATGKPIQLSNIIIIAITISIIIVLVTYIALRKRPVKWA